MIDVYLLSGFLGSGKTSLLVNLVGQVKQKEMQQMYIIFISRRLLPIIDYL